MELQRISRQDILTLFVTNPKGDLQQYLLKGQLAATHDANFLAHALAHDRRKGSVKDAQVGIPVVTLATHEFPRDFLENSLALLASLSPRDLFRAYSWAIKLRDADAMSWRRYDRFESMVHGYIRARETCWPWWERTALLFRRHFKALYALSHTKAAPGAEEALLAGHPPPGSFLGRVKQSCTWESDEVAGFIRAERLPFTLTHGLYGARCKEPAVLSAIVDQMSAGELARRARLLNKWGWKATAASRGAKQQLLARASQGSRRGRQTDLTKAIEALSDDDPLLAMELEAVQEAQLDAAGGIDGNWIVLVDRSPSQAPSIHIGRLLAAYLARRITGRLLLVFFDGEPTVYNATGKSLQEITGMTRDVVVGTSTSIGCGLWIAADREFQADAIAIVSDGGENAPPLFTQAYQRYEAFVGKQPPVYLYLTDGINWGRREEDRLSIRCEQYGMPYTVFNIRAGVDEAGLFALANTMRVQKFSLFDEIMHAQLLKLEWAYRPPKHFREEALRV